MFCKILNTIYAQKISLKRSLVLGFKKRHLTRFIFYYISKEPENFLQVESGAGGRCSSERGQAQAGPLLRHRHQGGLAIVATGRQPAQVGGGDGSAAGWR